MNIFWQRKESIISNLKSNGYYFAKVETYTELLDNKSVNIIHEIDLGNKGKIKKISFIGEKVFKDSKLRSIIISEEYKFWKFISGRKYLNEETISFDERLLKNFFLNKGYYDVKINSSFAKLINQDEFELIYNIDPGKKYFFGKLDMFMPVDFKKDGFNDLYELFNNLEGEIYSLYLVEKILKQIDLITLNQEFKSISAEVEEVVRK